MTKQKAEYLPVYPEEGHVTIRQLATEFQVDFNYLSKWVKKHGFEMLYVRAPGTRAQPLSALVKEDAEQVKEMWSRKLIGRETKQASTVGWFYIIYTPEQSNRIKVGFSTDVDARLSAFRIFAPTASLVECWPCKAGWELAAIASLTREGCKSISREVFDCDSVEAVKQRGEAFFALMPAV